LLNFVGKKTRKPRTMKAWAKLGKSGRRKAALKVRQSGKMEAVLMAARQIARKQLANPDMAFVMQKMQDDAELSSKLRKSLATTTSKLSPSEALCFILQKHISKSTYKAISLLTKEHGLNLLPSWDSIQVKNKTDNSFMI
jgi:hypothetical protein